MFKDICLFYIEPGTILSFYILLGLLHLQNLRYIDGLDNERFVYPNDIALLVLEEDIIDKSTIIKMAEDRTEYFIGKTCTISGWGRNGLYIIIKFMSTSVHPNISILCVSYLPLHCSI